MTISSNIFLKRLILPLCAGLCLSLSGAAEAGPTDSDVQNTLARQKMLASVKDNNETLDGVWNSRLWPSFHLRREASGFYKGRLAEADRVCGLSAGDEVLRGTIDSQGIFSGEIRVCAKRFCPGIQERWIYFMALASGNAIALSGAVAPTSYLGCNEVFQGMAFIATKTGGLPSEARLAKKANAGPEREGTASAPQQECATEDAMGTLELTNIPQAIHSVMIDSADWSAQPFIRPLQSGSHKIHLRMKNAPEKTETRTFCLPGGPTAFTVNVGELFGIENVPEEAESKERSAAACPGGKEKVPVHIVLPAGKQFTVTIDSKKLPKPQQNQVQVTLTAGEHKVAISGKNPSSEKSRTICVKANGSRPMTVKFEK